MSPFGGRSLWPNAQYWNDKHTDEVIANKHIQFLISPDSGAKQMIEPVFAHTKHNRQIN